MKKVTVFNNYYSEQQEEYARDFLLDTYGKESGWTSTKDVPDQDVWEQVANNEQWSWEDESTVMKDFFASDYFLLQGSVGTWQGRKAAGGIISSFDELSRVWEDCDYLHIYDEGGHFYIECSHHDGTNYFEVKRLTDHGYNFLVDTNSDRYHDRESHELAFESNFYTSLPHFAREVYGV